MKTLIQNRPSRRDRITILLVSVFVIGFLLKVPLVTGDDGLDRLLQKAKLQASTVKAQENPNVTCVIPNVMQEGRTIQPVGHSPEFQFTDPSGFSNRGEFCPVPTEVLPQRLDFGDACYDPERQYNPWNPHAGIDEYVFDGDDRGKRVMVDQSWNVYGLDTEDTVGHFDTLDGRRLVTPSNRVAIYAPRFAAVRKVDGLINAETRLRVGAVEENTLIFRSQANDFSSTTKQHLALERFDGADRASGLLNRNRGVVQENVTHLFGIRNSFKAYENLSLIRLGRFSKSETARLGLGLQSANVWQDNLGLQVAVDNVKPVVVNDVYKVQQLVTIESDDKAAILRVAKVASKISARPGETVDFTIRFDNLTGRKIGNVTIIDNLTGRLEYVPDSAECSLNANFIRDQNESGSLMLRWEVIDPLPANNGGIIRFSCRVR